MAINKVIYNTENGAETLIDLTRDSVTPETLAEGVTAHDASGNVIAGAMPTSAVRYTAQTLTDGQKAQARENIGAVAKSGISLGVHSDGLIYVFVDGSPVGDGIELATAGDVIGYVDENNNVILTGALADGTYNIKYEMEDGSTVDIGDLVLDTNVYYSVTNTLTNCSNSNGVTEVIEGGRYPATIIANEGYELSSVVVTMGGVDITETAVVNGNIVNIESVTGDISIVATAELADVVEPTNFCVVNGDGWISGGRCSSGGADREDSESYALTNYIVVQNGDIVYVENLNIATTTYSGLYQSDKTAIGGFKFASVAVSNYVKDVTLNSDNGQFTIDNANAGYIRICGMPTNVVNSNGSKFEDKYDINNLGIVVNIKRNGEWL